MNAPDSRARITRVNGPLVEVTDLNGVAVSELVELGPSRLPAEVVGISHSRSTLQAYEYTGGLAPGAGAWARGYPLSAPLGPWLLGGVFDGLLRPLKGGPTWLAGGGLGASTDDEWSWQPSIKIGDAVAAGSLLGVIETGSTLEYRVLAPAAVSGYVDFVSEAGSHRADEELVRVDGVGVTMLEVWPVRQPRPCAERRDIDRPLMTGQRVLDMLYPVGRGGSAAVPGGFGTGKTLLLQQVAKWCDADVIVYIGCGERGNEMADVLDEFAELTDPRTGGRLADRTVIIANTSNMPMMAREASIYSGVTVAEHFRDMGYHAVVIADSTSRWAEALREFASRSGVMPAEEGYPASLASSLAAFYERAGPVITLGGLAGSVTVIGAVSPPGGDLTEPVSALTQRFVRAVWSLDHDLAYARHYPAVSWSGSFSRDAATIASWYGREGDSGWQIRRELLSSILADSDRLTAFAELVGASSLPDRERVQLLAGRLVREGVLQQSSLVPNDAFCTTEKAVALADATLDVISTCLELVDGESSAADIEAFDFSTLLRAATDVAPDDIAEIGRRHDRIIARLRGTQ
ncbi:MAG TPA: V-type ATP synthase subunit A [Acidothermaceae bacterium]|nr:V-type ATP synthase subunit A [Acidothermaceae bacterium]